MKEDEVRDLTSSEWADINPWFTALRLVQISGGTVRLILIWKEREVNDNNRGNNHILVYMCLTIYIKNSSAAAVF